MLVLNIVQDAIGKDDKAEKEKAAGDKTDKYSRDIKDKKEGKGLLQ